MSVFVRFSKTLFITVTTLVTFSSVALANNLDAQQLGRLMDKLDRIERDMSLLQRQFYRGDAQASSGGDASLSAGIGAAQLEARLSEIEERLRMLTGKAEQAEFGQSRTLERLDKMAADNDFRFLEIEKKLGIAPTMIPTEQEAGKTSAGEDTKAAAKDRVAAPVVLTQPGQKAETSEEVTTKKPVKAGPSNKNTASGETNPSQVLGTLPVGEKAVAIREASKEAPEASEEEGEEEKKKKPTEIQLDKAKALMEKKKYPDAEKILKAIIKTNPTDSVSGEAYYILGDIYSLQKTPDKAAVQYLRSYKQFPKAAKASDSLFKAGVSLVQLNKRKEACAMFTKLANEYPDSTAQKKGAKEAKKLNCQ